MNNELEFADEKAKIAWETKEAIEKMWPDLPPENPFMKFYSIRFVDENETRGRYAILFSGNVVYTKDKGVFIIPERTIEILRRLEISFILE